jgi:hypothetical protein
MKTTTDKWCRDMRIATALWLLIMGTGITWAAAQEPPEPKTKIVAIVIKDCLRQIEWVGIATPEKWTLMHITEIDPETLKVFISTYKPTVYQTPDKCI